MGFCSKRYIFLSICLLQMLSVIERQVFDFLGFLWIPILVNFLEIIFIILGFFGAYQYRPKYIISYVLWHLFWLGWNVFIICLYLDIADLDHKTNKVLKLDPTSESWWIVQGPGCQRVVSLQDEPWKGAVENCYINYVHVEIFQAGIQCFLALTGVVIGIFLSQAFLEEDDTFSYEDAIGPDHLFLHPMYVSTSDNLNQHPTTKSNRTYMHNVKSGNRYIKHNKNSNNNKNKISCDAIRFPLHKSSSFVTFHNMNSRLPNVRPKSMCSSNNNDYFHGDNDY